MFSEIFIHHFKYQYIKFVSRCLFKFIKIFIFSLNGIKAFTESANSLGTQFRVPKISMFQFIYKLLFHLIKHLHLKAEGVLLFIHKGKLSKNFLIIKDIVSRRETLTLTFIMIEKLQIFPIFSFFIRGPNSYFNLFKIMLNEMCRKRYITYFRVIFTKVMMK